jgi:hypothetical protein
VTAGALALAGSANGSFVHTVTVADSGSIAGPASAAQFPLGWGPTEFAPTAELFESFQVTPANVGQMYLATSASDPDFDAAVLGFSDGLDGFLHFGFRLNSGAGIGTSGPESLWFFPDDPERVDFAGLTIKAITLTIDDFELIPSDETTAWSYQLTYTFSDIPEPATLLVMAASAAVLMRRRR